MTKNDVLKVIRKKMREEYKRPDCLCKSMGEFVLKSYNYSAIKEFRDYIFSQSDDSDIFKAIEEYRYKMDLFACNANTDQGNFFFSIAYDVVTDVLDSLI